MGSPQHPHDSYSRALSGALNGPVSRQDVDTASEPAAQQDEQVEAAPADVAAPMTPMPMGINHPDHPNYLPYEYPADLDEAPVLKIRVARWDLICTVVLTALLLYLAVATEWPHKLFGYLGKVCSGEDCGPVPYGVDMYIYPLTWGGIGAAIAAAGIGPFISLLRGWFMSFWPVLSLTALMVASVVGAMLTTFSERFW
jgi:hypothetical protein